VRVRTFQPGSGGLPAVQVVADDDPAGEQVFANPSQTRYRNQRRRLKTMTVDWNPGGMAV